jgi:hypothetical protein
VAAIAMVIPSDDPGPTKATPTAAAIKGLGCGFGTACRQTNLENRVPAIPVATATSSISSAGSLKITSPAATIGARAMPVIMSSGSEAGLNAARSNQAATLCSQALGRASTLGIVGNHPNRRGQAHPAHSPWRDRLG